MTWWVTVASALVVLAGTAVVRWWLCRGADSGRPATAHEVAFLNDGARLVVFTGLAELRRHRVVEGAGDGVIAVHGASPPAGALPVDRAILTALRRPRRAEELLGDPAVTAAVGAIGVRLVRRGWVLSERQQDTMRWYGLPGWAVAVVCLVQAAASGGRVTPTLVLLGSGVFLAVLTYLLVDVPPVTRAGRRVLRRARAELDDDAVIGARVAAYGEPELSMFDLEFAELAGAFSGELPPFPGQELRGF